MKENELDEGHKEIYDPGAAYAMTDIIAKDIIRKAGHVPESALMMLSNKEQIEFRERKRKLNLRLYEHRWLYALYELGLQQQIVSILAELKDVGLTKNDYQLDENNRKVYIPIRGGKITLNVRIITTKSKNAFALFYSDPFKPEAYEVTYDIYLLESSRSKNVEKKATTILNKYFTSDSEAWRRQQLRRDLEHGAGFHYRR